MAVEEVQQFLFRLFEMLRLVVETHHIVVEPYFLRGKQADDGDKGDAPDQPFILIERISVYFLYDT